MLNVQNDVFKTLFNEILDCGDVNWSSEKKYPLDKYIWET